MNILILALEEDFALVLLRALKSSGMRCYVWGVEGFYSVQLSRYCRGYAGSARSEFTNPSQGSISRINRLCDKKKIDLVLAADVGGAQLLSKIRDSISPAVKIFPTAASSQLEMLHNKWKFACFLKNNSILSPRTALLSGPEDIRCLNFTYPVIVKPLDLCNGQGVRRFDSYRELARYISHKGRYNKPPLIVQEYIPGEDIDLNILAENGRILVYSVQKWLSAEKMRFVTHKEAVDTGRRIVARCGYTGVVHFDMRIDSRNNSVKVIECNPRFWGSLKASHWNGVDFLGSGIKLARGERLQENHAQGMVTYILPDKALRRVIRGDLSILRDMPRETARDIRDIIFDPLSSAAHFLGMALKAGTGGRKEVHSSQPTAQHSKYAKDEI